MKTPKKPTKLARAQIENPYKVPKAQWRKWSAMQQLMFNQMFDIMISNMSLFQHPKANPPTSEWWKTTAWNAAWVATDLLGKP
jgi:hypothetical protein